MRALPEEVARERKVVAVLIDNGTLERALAALQAGDVAGAEQSFRALLRAQPRHVGALNLLGIALMRQGRFAEAEDSLRQAIEVSRSDATLFNYGLVLKALNRPEEALKRFTEALAINPAAAETWYNRGIVLCDVRRFADALADFAKALELNSHYAEAWFARGNALRDLKRYDEALSAYDRALALQPNWAVAHNNRGAVLFYLERYADALVSFDRSIALNPNLVLPHGNRAGALYYLKRYAEVLASAQRAISLDGAYADGWVVMGKALIALKRSDDALAAFDRALKLSNSFAEAWLGQGNALIETMRYAEAIPAFDKALALDPDLKYGADGRIRAKLNSCDWTDLDVLIPDLLTSARQERSWVFPVVMVTLPSSAADQLQCARRYVKDQLIVPSLWQGEVYSHRRIRVAYVSGDFRQHAVADLTIGLFENHDKTRFEVTGVSFGPEQESAMRHRIKGAFECVLDVGDKTDREIAGLLRAREIDIAVDLMGHMGFNRFGIFAHRAAPIQVNYLGYPGTSGAPYMDYILADATIVPEEHFDFYSETVVWLPESYFVCDSTRQPSERTPTRLECGLPQTGFVFCCFNNSYKLQPQMFDIWMRLLRAVDGSVLWLRQNDEVATRNLIREAERRGVAGERLIFAKRVPSIAEHLARHRQADLFLDTLPYNAHTTASDALVAGLPVLTCLGSTFAGRVAASLLHSVGLEELVTRSLEEYEALALKLARAPGLLASVTEKLARNRERSPLFDTVRATRQIEAAYGVMWERYQRGQTLSDRCVV